MRINKKLTVAVAATAVVALGAGVAVAYFTDGGVGHGTATVGGGTTWDVVVTSTDNDVLLPGAHTYNFDYSVTNLSDATQGLGSIVATIDQATDEFTEEPNGDIPGAPGCKASWFTVVASNSGLPTEVASDEAYLSEGTVEMNYVSENQDACKGKTPAFTLTVGAYPVITTVN